MTNLNKLLAWPWAGVPVGVDHAAKACNRKETDDDHYDDDGCPGLILWWIKQDKERRLIQ